MDKRSSSFVGQMPIRVEGSSKKFNIYRLFGPLDTDAFFVRMSSEVSTLKFYGHLTHKMGTTNNHAAFRLVLYPKRMTHKMGTNWVQKIRGKNADRKEKFVRDSCLAEN
jgi:hypothetical protein